MANMTVGTKVLCTFVGTMNSQRLLNTFPLVCTAVTGVITVADALDALNTKLTGAGRLKDKFIACCASNYSLDNIWLQVVAPLRQRKLAYVVGENGGIDAVSVAPNIAGVVSRFGEAANRHNIGSLHVPIPTEDGNVANGLVGDPAFGALQALRPEMEGFTSTAVFVATYSFALFPTPVTGAAVNVVATQVQGTSRVMRRRTVGVGK